jgi:hypothetical protein
LFQELSPINLPKGHVAAKGKKKRMSGVMDMLLVLEKQPIIGQLLIWFNHLTRHYKSWQVREFPPPLLPLLFSLSLRDLLSFLSLLLLSGCLHVHFHPSRPTLSTVTPQSIE